MDTERNCEEEEKGMWRGQGPSELTADTHCCLGWRDLEAREDDAVRDVGEEQIFFFFLMAKSSH